MEGSISIQAPEKILIIRISSIGDIILTTPVVRLLKRKFPASQIDYVINKDFADLLIYHPAIRQLFLFDKNDNSYSLKSIKLRIKQEHYDLILDLHKNFRSFYLTFGTKAKNLIRFSKGVIPRFFFVKFRLNFYKKIIPTYLRYIDCLKHYQIIYDHQGLEIFFNDQVKDIVLNKYSQFLFKSGSLIVGIAPGANHATKRWTPEGFEAVVDYLIETRKSKIIIFGSREDREVVQLINHKNPQSVLDTTGALSIIKVAVLMNYCDLIISNDSGLMHLAVALRKKVVAIFGSTTEELGFFPYATEHIVVQNDGLKCRPCSHVGRNKCPKKHFKCMKDITARQVIEAIETLLINSQ